MYYSDDKYINSPIGLESFVLYVILLEVVIYDVEITGVLSHDLRVRCPEINSLCTEGIKIMTINVPVEYYTGLEEGII